MPHSHALRLLSTLALVSVCSLVAAGCHGSAHDVPRDPPVIHLALGAEVLLGLTQDFDCDRSPDLACLYERPHELGEISLSEEGVVELGEVDSDGRSVVIEVRALAAGEVDLVLDYRDFFGERYRDRFVLRVEEVTRVEARVFCDGEARVEGPFPVLAGSSLSVATLAFAGETQLATGVMDLVEDYDGFEVMDQPEDSEDSRRVVAPTELGEISWTLAGAESAPLEFVVIDGGSVELELRPTVPDVLTPPGVTLGRVVDGAPLCAFDGDSRAVVEVTAGECRPVLHGFELLGQVPLMMGEGDLPLELTGEGECTVTARSAEGDLSELTLEVDNPYEPEAPSPGRGDALSTRPLEVGGELLPYGTCPTVINLTDGDCEIVNAMGLILPDVDCLLDWEWMMHHHDGATTDEELHDAIVGVGLATELHVKINYELTFFTVVSTPPSHLELAVDPAAGLVIESSGCNDEREILGLFPEAAGDYEIHFRADNVYEDARWTLRARDVAEVRFRNDVGGELFFAGAVTELDIAYADAAGGQLRGIAPFLISSDIDGGGATIEGTTLSVGTTPQQILLASHRAPQQATITVVDAEAITGVAGLDVEQVALGQRECLELSPLGSGGRPIFGPPPIRPQVTLTGEALAIEANTWPPPHDGELCLRGQAAGEADLEASWGDGTAQQRVTVE